MVLLIDVGNSNICISTLKDDEISKSFRVKTSTSKSEDEYYLLIKEFVKEEVNDVIISSVVPIITSTLNKLFKNYYGIKPKLVGSKLKTGVNIVVDDPKSVGADLICDVAGGIDYYDEALIVDLGTASKFIYYKNKTFCGLSIAPGVAKSLKSMIESAALLPNIELEAPKKVINTSTIPCMQSGVIYGFTCLVDGMIKRIKAEINKPDLKVIATGGLMKIIKNYMEENIDVYDDLLTIKGIYNIYKRNVK